MQKLFKNPLFYIFLLALFLRIFRLGDVPGGFHVDEVKVGWNAYSILHTGEDDWGNKLPLHYNSFGDYRPTGIIYLTIPFIKIFGLSEQSVRIPAAVFGSLSIISIFYFTKLLSGKKGLALSASFFLAISPWHITLSRSTSEGIIALFLVLTGITFILLAHSKARSYFLLYSFFFLFLSYFFYHSSRLITPIFASIIVFYLLYSKKVSLGRKYLWGLLATLFICTFLFGSMKEARGRFNQVSVFNDLDIQTSRQEYPFEDGQNNVLVARVFHNKFVLYTVNFIEEYARYFSADFLIGDTGKPIRYSIPDHGMMMYIEFVLCILGIAALLQKKYPGLPILLLAIAPLPAALTTEDAPNLHRAIFMIPFLSIITSYGFFEIRKSVKYFYYFPFILVFIVTNFVYFWHLYIVHSPVHEPIPMNRNSGVKQAIELIQSNKEDFDMIYLTNIPDSLYPWYAFYTKPDPKEFNSKAKNRDKGRWEYKNITFGEIKCPTKDINPLDYPNKRILFLDTEGCDNVQVLGNIYHLVQEVKRYRGGAPYTFWKN